MQKKDYPCIANGIPQNKILITGNCTPVKTAIIEEQLRRAGQQNFSVIILDYARQGDFSKFLGDNSYPLCHSFFAETDSYTPLECSLREETLNLRDSAKKNNYSHKEHATMVALISFLSELEKKCGSVSKSAEEMLEKFKNQQKFEDFLKAQVINRKIKRKEVDDYIQTYLEYVPSGIIAGILIAEKRFMLDNGGNNFSLSNLNQGEAAVLYADRKDSQDVNDFLSKAWTDDILKLSKKMPLLVIVNSGMHTQIERMSELVGTLSKSYGTGLIYCAYDLFSGCEQKYAENFTNPFEYVAYGQHSGSSASYISSLFGERWTYHYSYTSNTANHIIEEWLPVAFSQSLTITTGTNRTQAKEPVFPQETIMYMNTKEYILKCRLENKFFKASVF